MGLEDGTKEGMKEVMHELEQGWLVEAALHLGRHEPQARSQEVSIQEFRISAAYGMSPGV